MLLRGRWNLGEFYAFALGVSTCIFQIFARLLWELVLLAEVSHFLNSNWWVDCENGRPVDWYRWAIHKSNLLEPQWLLLSCILLNLGKRTHGFLSIFFFINQWHKKSMQKLTEKKILSKPNLTNAKIYCLLHVQNWFRNLIALAAVISEEISSRIERIAFKPI